MREADVGRGFPLPLREAATLALASAPSRTVMDARRAEALGARLPPLMVAAERVAATVAQGVHGRRRVGQGDSFWQFRPFVAGDPIARIDWRQSAKSGRPAPHGWFIRETEWEAAQTACLWRDGSPQMRWRSRLVPVEKCERAGLLLLALASLLLRGGERVMLIAHERATGFRPCRARPAGGGTGRYECGRGRPAAARFICHAMPAWCCSVTFLSPLEDIQAEVGRLSAIPVTGTCCRCSIRPRPPAL